MGAKEEKSLLELLLKDSHIVQCNKLIIHLGRTREKTNEVDDTDTESSFPVLSWPHFLHAEEKYQEAVEGLKPDPSSHGFWFDIQQVTGTTLSAKVICFSTSVVQCFKHQARIQINMSVKKLEMFEALSSINDTLIPILWFEEGIDELGDHQNHHGPHHSMLILVVSCFFTADPNFKMQFSV